MSLLAGLALLPGAAWSAGANFSGFWQLQTRSAAAEPVLTDWARTQQGKVKLSGEAPADDLQWCVEQGLPYVMDQAGPIDIIVAPRELVIAAEKLALQRHLYSAGQQRPNMRNFDPTPVGNTLAHWQGDTLTAETVGLSTGIGPAGVPRTESSRLSEHFQVSGDTLTVTSIWSDPKTLRRPYRYTLVYHRLPAAYTAVESYCDPRANGVGHP